MAGRRSDEKDRGYQISHREQLLRERLLTVDEDLRLVCVRRARLVVANWRLKSTEHALVRRLSLIDETSLGYITECVLCITYCARSLP